MLSTTGWLVLLAIFGLGAVLVALPRVVARRDRRTTGGLDDGEDGPGT